MAIGGTMIEPPADSTAFTVASASSVWRYTDQMSGGPAPSITGLSPATRLPFLWKLR